MAKGEESEGPWRRLFERAQRAGLDLDAVLGVTSDGALGLLAYLRRGLGWVQHQRCVWHLWRNLSGEMSRAASRAAAGLTGEDAESARQQARAELTGLIHEIMDAKSYQQAEAGLATLGNRCDCTASAGRNHRQTAQPAVGSGAGAPAALLPRPATRDP